MELINQIIILGSALLSVASFASAPLPIPVVMTEKAKLSELAQDLAYPARVESRVNAQIYSESDGVITKIAAPLGSKIKRHGRLATVQHTDPVYQYAPMSIISPVEGVVSQVAVTEGSTVTKGQLLASVTDPSQLRIMIEIAASDLPLFKTDLVGKFAVTGESETEIAVQIGGISPFVDPASGTATCELKILANDTQAALLPPGSVGQVHFKTNSHQAFIFPENAIVYKGNETFVRLVKGDIARRIPVTLGRRQRGMVEVLKGVKAGDQVIDRASQFVADGDKVQVDNTQDKVE